MRLRYSNQTIKRLEKNNNRSVVKMEIKNRLKLWKSNMQYRLKTKMADRATVSEKLKTAELCLEAVKQDGMILRLVPRKYKTKELCFEAVKQKGNALAYVPEKHKTTELCFYAMKRGHVAYKHISKKLKKSVKKQIKSEYHIYDERISKYPIELLEILAMYIYRNEDFCKEAGSPHNDLLRSILTWRKIKLNRKFEWTAENKQDFLKVNEKLKIFYETAYNRALSVAGELERG